MDVAAQIYELLQMRGWTQGELSIQSGVSEQQISKILSGHANPGLKTLVKIEAALDEDVIVAPKFYKKALNKKGFTITKQPLAEDFLMDFSDLFAEKNELINDESNFRSFPAREYHDNSYDMPVENFQVENRPQAA